VPPRGARKSIFRCPRMRRENPLRCGEDYLSRRYIWDVVDSSLPAKASLPSELIQARTVGSPHEGRVAISASPGMDSDKQKTALTFFYTDPDYWDGLFQRNPGHLGCGGPTGSARELLEKLWPEGANHHRHLKAGEVFPSVAISISTASYRVMATATFVVSTVLIWGSFPNPVFFMMWNYDRRPTSQTPATL